MFGKRHLVLAEQLRGGRFGNVFFLGHAVIR
jgi:hypothetical protein